MKAFSLLLALALIVVLTGCETSAEPRAAAPPARPIRALIVGGGQHHDFNRWFNQADVATLSSNGLATVSYTDRPEAILPALGGLDVLYLSNNQPLPDPALRAAIFEFVGAGRGLLLIHPALWYNWPDWPEYNRLLVGGGSRSHPPYGEFEVTVLDPTHPTMVGVPEKFTIKDELYRSEKDPLGPPIQILATGFEKATGKTYPVAWIVLHPRGRIFCSSLGHDGAAHEHPAFQAILRNGLKWAAGR
jgi:hypothetical protein